MTRCVSISINIITLYYDRVPRARNRLCECLGSRCNYVFSPVLKTIPRSPVTVCARENWPEQLEAPFVQSVPGGKIIIRNTSRLVSPGPGRMSGSPGFHGCVASHNINIIYIYKFMFLTYRYVFFFLCFTLHCLAVTHVKNCPAVCILIRIINAFMFKCCNTFDFGEKIRVRNAFTPRSSVNFGFCSVFYDSDSIHLRL